MSESQVNTIILRRGLRTPIVNTKIQLRLALVELVEKAEMAE